MLTRWFDLLAVASLAVAQTTFTATAAADVARAAATARTESPVSNVKGKSFDRILTIYLETTAFNNTIADGKCTADNLQPLRAHPLTLPSELRSPHQARYLIDQPLRRWSPQPAKLHCPWQR